MYPLPNPLFNIWHDMVAKPQHSHKQKKNHEDAPIHLFFMFGLNLLQDRIYFKAVPASNEHQEL